MGTHVLQHNIDGIDTLRYIDSFGSSTGEHVNYADDVSVCNVKELNTCSGEFTVSNIDFYNGISRAVSVSDADSIKLSVYNIKNSSENISCCVAMYSDDILKDVKYASYKAEPYEVIDVDENITVTDGTDKIVCYLWNNENQQPYISKYILNQR